MKWINELPTKHFLAIDPSIHGAEEGTPEVRTVVHVHGAKVLPEHDGYPEAWITSDGKTGPTYDAKPNVYPNDQAACTLWYHDHALGITRLNVVAGLAGFYVIRDDEEDALNLPSGEYEIPLLIQDRSFLADGTLWYPPAHERDASDVDAGIFRRDDLREWEGDAVSGSRAAEISISNGEWFEFAVLSLDAAAGRQKRETERAAGGCAGVSSDRDGCGAASCAVESALFDFVAWRAIRHRDRFQRARGVLFWR